MLETIYEMLIEQGVDLDSAVMLSRWVSFALALALAGLGYLLARRVVLPMLFYSIDRSETPADDIFWGFKPFHHLTLLVPLAILYGLTPVFLEGYANLVRIVQSGFELGMIAVGTVVVNAFLNGAQAIYEQRQIARELPLRSFLQVLRFITFFVAGILILAVLIDKTPGALLAGLGALSAVLMLIFQDPLMGLVAGIQLTSNQLVARGDVIEVPKYDASGEVLDIALTTVMVRNADQSITTVPTYSLISESFKNWRGIEETQARRIMRGVLIDMTTIEFCSAETLDQLAQQPELINTLDDIHGLEKPTNLTLLRAYLTNYLKQHPRIYADRTIVVRQQPITASGLPLELYCYTSELDFVRYEQLQADIMEHVLAMLPTFGLRVFQSPTVDTALV